MSHKFCARAVMSVLAGVLLLCTLAVVAALDEIARLPFYDTLPVAACLVNATAWLLLWRRSERRDVPLPRLSGLAERCRDLFRRPARASGSEGQSVASYRRLVVTKQNGAGPVPPRPEVKTALRKIHSVAWGYPAKRRAGNAFMEEVELNHEARQ